MKLTFVLGWLAAGLLLAGVIIGFLPVSGVSGACGSVFSAANSFDSGADCDQVRSGLRGMPVLLIVMGVAMVCAAFAASLSYRETSSEPAAV